MLKIEEFTAAYRNDYPIIEDINLIIQKGEKVGIMGRNGAGKSTFVKALMKLTPFYSGSISFEDLNLMDLPSYEYVNHGISYFMQGGTVFPNLSVKENLEIAALGSHNSSSEDAIIKFTDTFSVFTKLEFLKQKAGNLSGGERNILALCMIMVSNPRLLILDEPMAGISPGNVKLISNFLSSYIKETECTLLLIEQNRNLVEDLCDQSYILGKSCTAGFDSIFAKCLIKIAYSK